MSDIKTYTVCLTGIVQGVGMRPFIYKTANLMNLTGWVSNHGSSVVIEVTGMRERIKEFLTHLLNEAPPGTKICSIRIRKQNNGSHHRFSIVSSSSQDDFSGMIPPDTAVCDECISEIYDKLNPRYMYPFTNCTVCGPRYSILKHLPYDRVNTSMSSFKMCLSCLSEYEDPCSRRFHAQTNCCPDCGPGIFLYDNKRRIINKTNSISTACELLKEGKVIAIKGIGGYHLACNACDEKAIGMLRLRKERPDKPFAVMVVNIEAARVICNVSNIEEEILTNRQRPIVLLEKKYPEFLPGNIAPGLNRMGIMLPYTPLHHMLFNYGTNYLIMTSGNISGMPICYRDDDAFEQLERIADFFLVHNREILTPIDDSIVRVIEEKEVISRCARGYAPAVIKIKAYGDILASGAEQKSNVCILNKDYAKISQYLGSVDEMKTYEEYVNTAERLKILYKVSPEVIAHDLHPGYLSTKYSHKHDHPIPIQHHHAHMAASMAENSISDAIGIIYDGTGLGTDGAIWGGEFFIGSLSKYLRVGHWKYVKLQGGDSAVKEPWKSASSYLYGMDLSIRDFMGKIDISKIRVIESALKNDINCFNSSSMGRLFDCASALITNRTHITYDAQAAIELESMADYSTTDNYCYFIDDRDDVYKISYEGIIKGILKDLKDGEKASYISKKFHNSICEATVECTCLIREKYRKNVVVLSGGVFENILLLSSMIKKLADRKFDVYFPMKIPTNDAGISFGQAVIANQLIKEGVYVPGSTC